MSEWEDHLSLGLFPSVVLCVHSIERVRSFAMLRDWICVRMGYFILPLILERFSLERGECCPCRNATRIMCRMSAVLGIWDLPEGDILQVSERFAMMNRSYLLASLEVAPEAVRHRIAGSYLCRQHTPLS